MITENEKNELAKLIINSNASIRKFTINIPVYIFSTSCKDAKECVQNNIAEMLENYLYQYSHDSQSIIINSINTEIKPSLELYDWDDCELAYVSDELNKKINENSELDNFDDWSCRNLQNIIDEVNQEIEE